MTRVFIDVSQINLEKSDELMLLCGALEATWQKNNPHRSVPDGFTSLFLRCHQTTTQHVIIHGSPKQGRNVG
jgi:hypothetical protein